MKRLSSQTREHAVHKKFPGNTLNNTTVNTLGNSEAVIEVFPPEIFFKGTYSIKDEYPFSFIIHTL